MAPRYRWDDFVLDLDSYRLERAGAPLALEPKAFNLLALMVRRPRHLFSKQEIFEALWPDTAVTDHALTRVVAQLRRVLGDEAREARYLETVPTRGYRWIKDVEEVLPASAAPVAVAEPQLVAHPRRPESPRLSGMIAAFALGLVVLAFLAWAARQEGTSAAIESVDIKPRWPVQVTTHGGLDMHPAISPHGDAIAFVSDRSGDFEIYVRALSGGSADVPLTSDRQQNMQPAWSPDGRFIAYHANRRGGIWVMPARGGTAKQISPFGARPAWSHDGARIAFQTDELGDIAPNGFSAQAGSTIWIANADGSNARALTTATSPAGGHASPAWSPDGRFIAFTVFDSGTDNGVWIVSVESGATWPLDLNASFYDPVFAGDASAVYATGAEALIVRLPFDSKTGKLRGPREMIPIAGVPGARGLSLSPDGRRLAFSGMALESQIWSLPLTADGGAGEPAPLTRDTSRRNSLAMISPDGSKVAYMSIRQGELPNIWVMNIDGGNPTQLTSDETADHKPHWFPDGKRIAYLTKRGRSGALWSVNIETRREELVFEFPGQENEPRLDGRLAEFDISPSLNKIAFSLISPATGLRTLFTSPTSAFTPTAVGPRDSSAGYPSWSPDEARIAVEIKDGSSTHAGVIDTATGTLRQLTRERGHTWVRSWSPDGKKLAVAAMRDGRWSLRWIDAATGQDGPLTPPYPPATYLRYPEWSPQGDRMVFERGVSRGNIWMIPVD